VGCGGGGRRVWAAQEGGYPGGCVSRSPSILVPRIAACAEAPIARARLFLTSTQRLMSPCPTCLSVAGDLGEGRYGDAGGGRTEGYYASLMEAPDRLRPGDLNEVLQPDHMGRLRFTNFPLQSYGVLFKWEVRVRRTEA
jgi:hypothetical protein